MKNSCLNAAPFLFALAAAQHTTPPHYSGSESALTVFEVIGMVLAVNLSVIGCMIGCMKYCRFFNSREQTPTAITALLPDNSTA